VHTKCPVIFDFFDHVPSLPGFANPQSKTNGELP
jgi:hypothetical protein